MRVVIDEITDANYKFMQAMENGFDCKFWYEVENTLFGGDSGITAKVVDAGMNLPRGNGEIMTLFIDIEWQGAAQDEFCKSPIDYSYEKN